MYNIAYATGSRAEYGITKRYLKKLSENSEINLELLVTGTHLDHNYGYTIDEILNDDFNVALKVPFSINTEKNEYIIKSMAIVLEKFGEFFENKNYDLVIILGDRYEMLSVATAAAMHNLPILHIHGGEKTLGNYDEFIRHSITKMSLYHFTSTEIYKNRVIQLGENPSRVYNLGALGAENAILNIDSEFSVEWKKPYFVILYHPETLTGVSPSQQIDEVLKALNKFKNYYHFVFIGGNADTHADEITKRIYEYSIKNDSTYITNVENKKFQNIVHNAEVYIGNSSSGIIEAPSLGTYSVNIGERQKGRVKANSTISTSCSEIDIIDAINDALEFKDNNIKIENPYYQENSLEKYLNTTLYLLKNSHQGVKDFYDLKGE